jgi:hypothetical protein
VEHTKLLAHYVGHYKITLRLLYKIQPVNNFVKADSRYFITEPCKTHNYPACAKCGMLSGAGGKSSECNGLRFPN